MARKLRVEYSGAIYHVMNRGDRCEAIFLDDSDRELFLRTLGETCAKTGWFIHAYCLMGNHFHLVLETPQANLVSGMRWFLGTYTSRFNRRHKVFGHLFSGRYKSLVVDGSGNGYLKTVCDYVHLNPVRAGFLKGKEPLKVYPWSSFPMYLKNARQRPEWLKTQALMGEHGIPKDSAAGRKEFQRRMELRRWEENEDEWKKIRRGWCLGDESFRKELLEQMSGRGGESHYGPEKQESAEARAERIVQEELRKIQWSEEDLDARQKGDIRKVRIARKLRKETVVTLKWIAARLKMGTWTHVSNRLYHIKR